MADGGGVFFLSLADGFQLLHAVYAVECFLANLKKRKCNFHLVFFEGTCVPRSRRSGG